LDVPAFGLATIALDTNKVAHNDANTPPHVAHRRFAQWDVFRPNDSVEHRRGA